MIYLKHFLAITGGIHDFYTLIQICDSNPFAILLNWVEAP